MISNGQISSTLTELSARDTSGFLFPDDNLIPDESIDFHQTCYGH